MSFTSNKYIRAYLSIFKGETYNYIVPLPLEEVKASLKELLATTGFWSYPNITGTLKGGEFKATTRWGGIMRPRGPEASIAGKLDEISFSTTSIVIKTQVHITSKILAVFLPLAVINVWYSFLFGKHEFVTPISPLLFAILTTFFFPFMAFLLVYKAYSKRKELRQAIEKHLNTKPLPQNPTA